MAELLVVCWAGHLVDSLADDLAEQSVVCSVALWAATLADEMVDR